MAIDPTVVYFGEAPTTIVMQSSTDFNGGAQTSTPVITPGTYTFPAQAGGGKYDFHEYPVRVSQVDYKGGGTLTITKVIKGITGASMVVGTITTSGVLISNIDVGPGEYLTFSSSGATNPVVAVIGRLARSVGAIG